MVEKKNVWEALESVETMKLEDSVQAKLEAVLKKLVRTREDISKELEKSHFELKAEYEKSMLVGAHPDGGQVETERRFMTGQFDSRKVYEDSQKEALDEYENAVKEVFNNIDLENADLRTIADVSHLIWSFANIGGQ
ncbi:hypothetical protein D3C71_625450 [compost metagenome]